METLRTHPVLEWGVATQALGGQPVSGDQHLVKPLPNGVLVVVVDGLGHGQEAAAAANAAIAMLEGSPHASLIELVRGCHEALTQTRGVVMSLAAFNEVDEKMTWLGVGNVEGVLLRGDGGTRPARASLLLRGGVVGYQLPTLSTATVTVSRGDILIFATDGVDSNFATGVMLGASPQRLAARILAQHGKETDDALVLVARWKGKGR